MPRIDQLAKGGTALRLKPRAIQTKSACADWAPTPSLDRVRRRHGADVRVLLAILLVFLAVALGGCDSQEQTVAPGTPQTPDSELSAARPLPPTSSQPDTSVAPEASLSSPPEQALEAELKRTPPSRDLFSLRRRLNGVLLQSLPQREPSSEPAPMQPGDRRQFWILDSPKKAYFQIWAVLKYATPDIYFFVQDSYDFPDEDIQRAATDLSIRTVPGTRKYFGSEWTPGIDGDPHIVVLNASIPGAPGYFYSSDEYPSQIVPYSNEHEMIYVNLRYNTPSSGGFYSTFAHEFQHMIHWNNDPSEDAWVNEGLSELASRLAGHSVDTAAVFASLPDTQLNAWDQDSAKALPHYGASYAFFSYLAEHYGGYEGLKDLVKEKKHGIAGVEEFLRSRGYSATFEDVFKDWVVANFLDDPNLEQGRYGYKDLDLKINPQNLGALPFRSSTNVHQYASRYLELPAGTGDLDVAFAGTPQTKLVPNEPHSGKGQWWSNRGDVMDATLTREFDLTGVDRATLKAWLWYDIEEDFDYAYAESSTDGGQTWTILPGKHTTTSNPNGSSFGPAYTGRSGDGSSPQWVQEEFDLTPNAGKRTLVRFEYVTDDSGNGVGFVLDDVSIPELGYAYDAETDGGWLADGFVRSENYVPQNYIIQLVERGQRTTVKSLPLDPEQKGHWRLRRADLAGRTAFLIISATAPATTQPATYELSVEEAR